MGFLRGGRIDRLNRRKPQFQNRVASVPMHSFPQECLTASMGEGRPGMTAFSVAVRS